MTRSLSLVAVVLTLLANQALLNAEEARQPTGSADILPENAALQQLWNAGEFTEGVAVGPDGKVYFSDIPKVNPGKVYRFDPQTGKTDVFCGDSGKSNGLMFDAQGHLFASCGANAGRRALCQIAADGTVRDVVAHYNGKRFNAPNDIVIHPDGGIYFSDPRYVGDEPIELDHMSVYRFDPKSKTVQRVTTNISKPNGLILSPGGKTLYVAETDNGTPNLAAPGEPGEVSMTLNAFPVNPDGALGEKTVIADFGQKTGIDGMTMDVQGHIYGALRNDQRFGIIVLTPKGKEIAYIPTPELPTNCDFGVDEESNVLYITAGGGLYRIRLKIDGYHPVLTAKR